MEERRRGGAVYMKEEWSVGMGGRKKGREEVAEKERLTCGIFGLYNV